MANKFSNVVLQMQTREDPSKKGREKPLPLKNGKKRPSKSDVENTPNTFRKRFANASKTIYHTLGLKHMAFILVLVAYALLGGIIFKLIEEPVESQKKIELQQNLEKDAKTLTAQLQTTNSAQEIYELVREYQRTSGLLPTKQQHNRKNWDFWGSMFYAGTIFTTIGYGHYAPQTDWGRVATMCYAVIGIPLVLATLADLGRLLTKTFKKIWSYCLWLSKHCRQASHKRKAVDDMENMDESTAEQFDLPIPLAILLFAGWLLLCSAIFCTWETNWNYFTAFYFFFISLSTIGLGDVTPDHPKFLILAFPLVIMGLSLVSMVINLIQNKIEAVKEKTTEYLEEELGFDTESSSDEDSQQQEAEPSGHKHPGSSEQPLPEGRQPTSLGVIQTWRRRARRKRRAIQTDDSYLRDLKKKFPALSYSKIPAGVSYSRSRDDVNSLVESLGVF